jgi:hypothetical protein
LSEIIVPQLQGLVSFSQELKSAENTAKEKITFFIGYLF